MANDGLETVDPRRTQQCLPALHDWTPIIEGNETVGLVCIVCGKRVRESMERSYLAASPHGLIDTRQKTPSRKDPRF